MRSATRKYKSTNFKKRFAIANRAKPPWNWSPLLWVVNSNSVKLVVNQTSTSWWAKIKRPCTRGCLVKIRNSRMPLKCCRRSCSTLWVSSMTFMCADLKLSTGRPESPVLRLSSSLLTRLSWFARSYSTNLLRRAVRNWSKSLEWISSVCVSLCPRLIKKSVPCKCSTCRKGMPVAMTTTTSRTNTVRSLQCSSWGTCSGTMTRWLRARITFWHKVSQRCRKSLHLRKFQRLLRGSRF